MISSTSTYLSLRQIYNYPNLNSPETKKALNTLPKRIRDIFFPYTPNSSSEDPNDSMQETTRKKIKGFVTNTLKELPPSYKKIIESEASSHKRKRDVASPQVPQISMDKIFELFDQLLGNWDYLIDTQIKNWQVQCFKAAEDQKDLPWVKESLNKAREVLTFFLYNKNATELDLSDLHLPFWPPIFDFPFSLQLETLRLTNNLLTNIPSNIIRLSALKDLQLTDNPLKDLSETFQFLKKCSLRVSEDLVKETLFDVCQKTQSATQYLDLTTERNETGASWISVKGVQFINIKSKHLSIGSEVVQGQEKTKKLALDKISGQVVARLIIKLDRNFICQIQGPLQTQRILSHLEPDTPGIVKTYFSAIIQSKKGFWKYVSYEHNYNQRDLRYTIHHLALSEQQKTQITHDLLLGLAKMHELGIYHLDLKPQNILVDKDKNGNCKAAITDFSGSMLREDLSNRSKTFTMTPSFASLETFTLFFRRPSPLTLEELAKAGDAWSLGLVLCFLWYDAKMPPPLSKMSHSSPTDALRQLQQHTQETGNESLFPKELPATPINNLIRKLLIINPRDRLSVSDALEQFELEKAPPILV
ncbi:MAG: lipopolysaccharide kinase InaA family protein [Chlamydiales bacterium]|nr:lipopolysaccharide kinase InaA family protein [Chlamydiales bacterium]